MACRYFVYILANRRNGALYVGVTNDLARRMAEHKGGFVPGFTEQYGIDSWSTWRNRARFSRRGHANAR